jgi:hypothetical protein
MLIAGGEPLIHPQILDIVKLVKSLNVKPILITNGVDLDRQFAVELKRAGAFGFTFHVDSHQSRPGWKNKHERELNELRQELADMMHEIGGLTCSFNITVFPDTVAYVPDILRWALDNSDRVRIMTFICVRTAERNGQFDYCVGGRKVDFSNIPYATSESCKKLTTHDIHSEIKKVLPDMEFCAYLGGTVLPDSLKWVLGTHFTSSGQSFGRFGRKSMELVQNAYHFFNGCYLAYTGASTANRGKLALFLGIFDPEVRRAARSFAGAILRNPLRLLKPLYIQNISVVQPVDILESGEQDSCDGCPNKTLWGDMLVSACRLEEYRHFGGPVLTIPKHQPLDDKLHSEAQPGRV